MHWISFSTGLPSMDMIVIEGIGLATFEKHFENGGVQVYIGNGRRMRLDSSYRWRYAKY